MALYFWLRNLELLSTKDRLSIVESRLTWNGRTPEENNLPILFSGKFMVTVMKALDKGDISERRAASLLDLSTDALRNVMAKDLGLVQTTVADHLINNSAGKAYTLATRR